MTTVSQPVIDARLARFAATHNARDLWPEVPRSSFRAAERELARVAARVLNGSGAPPTLQPPPEGDLHALGVAACAAGIGALVGYWCESGTVEAEPAVRRLFATHLDHGRRRAARLREAFERILVHLADRGVEVLVLKGTHTRYTYFPDPGSRITSDVDLLVRPDDWQAVRDGLRDLGFEEQRDSRHPGQSFWSLPDARVVHALDFTHADSAWSLDLHRSLERTPFGGLSTALGTPDVGTAEVWEEFSRPVRILSQPLLLAYLALHASSHFYAMSQIRLIELVLVARHDFAGRPERWRAFDDLIARTGVSRFVFPALNLAERLVPGIIDPLVLAHIGDAAPRRLRRLVRNTQPATAQRLHPFPGLRERFVWIATPKEALAAFSWLAWPRDREKPVSLRAAPGAQWRRIQRPLRRIARAWTPKRLAFHEVMAVLGVGDLHPGGSGATAFLLEQVAKERPRIVLEIGAGIGLTSARMVGRGWHVVPIEPNPILRRCLEARLSVQVRPDDLETFAGDEGPFDAVIGESVFYGMGLAAAFKKVHRMLRPGGLLALVEMVWTERAEPQVATRVHDETRDTFGIPMASRERLTWSNWKALLNEAGFVQVIERRLEKRAGRRARSDRSITVAAALRHPLAFAQHLKYGYLSRSSPVPPAWLETWMAVWRRP